MKNGNLKSTLFIALVALTFGAASSAQAEAPDCGGCDRVQAAQKAFKALPAKTRQAPASLLQKGLESLQKLKTTKGVVTQAQARELVELLRVSGPYDFGGFVLDGNTALITKNMQVIMEEVRRLPSKEAKDVEEAIRVDQESNVSDFVN